MDYNIAQSPSLSVPIVWTGIVNALRREFDGSGESAEDM